MGDNRKKPLLIPGPLGPGKDLAGMRSGILTVISFAGRYQLAHGCYKVWNVKCDCGTSLLVQHRYLANGEQKSCGCLKPEITKALHTKHGQARKSLTYGRWKAMRQRCNYPRHFSWESYGGKGITVCKEWSEFEKFLQDMGECPAGYSLERIDINKPYQPENCCWIPKNQQGANTSRTKRARTLNGIRAGMAIEYSVTAKNKD